VQPCSGQNSNTALRCGHPYLLRTTYILVIGWHYQHSLPRLYCACTETAIFELQVNVSLFRDPDFLKENNKFGDPTTFSSFSHCTDKKS